MPETTPLPVLRWPCDLARPAPHRVQIFRGETVRLEALLTLNGAPVEIPAGATATLAWQSRDMGGSWYVAEASLDAERGTVWADFGPDMDAGADEYRAFLRVDTDGACYRAVAALQILPSPGATINEIPIPPRVLDFATIEVLNAPYWTKAEADGRFASVADATLNERGFGEWTILRDGVDVTSQIQARPTFVGSGLWDISSVHIQADQQGAEYAIGNENAQELTWLAASGDDVANYTATRTALPGYVLGNQTEKPIPKLSDVPAVVAPSTSASDAGKAADAKATGDALAGKLDKSGGILSGPIMIEDETTGAFAQYADGGIGHGDNVNSYALNFPAKDGTAALTSDLPSSETWTFEVDDGQGGTETVTKSVAVYAAQGGA